MTMRTPRRPKILATLWLSAILCGGFVRADTPPPDTSEWRCKLCPFFQGYAAEVDAGPMYASGANDSYGRYTGINHSATYADLGASGQWRDSDGAYAQYQLANLGLASRDGRIDAGREGRYDVQLDYHGQPSRLFDTTATPYRGAGSDELTLPGNWVTAGSTGGMSELRRSLSPVGIDTDRRTLSLTGKLFAGTHWTVYTRLSHQEKKGTGLTSASFLSDAAQLPEPIDYTTDTLEGGASWVGRIANVRIAYSGSWFQDHTDSLTWQNPYLPLLPGESLGRMALPPSNNLQQGSLSGEVQLPILKATHLSYSASLGRLRQNDAFLPDSTLPGSVVPAQGSLNGNVRISHYALALSSRPSTPLYLRGTAAYDGRDDHTAVLAIPYTITDELQGGTFPAPRYGEDRTRLDGSADYRLRPWISVGIAGNYLHTHYSPGQVSSSAEESRSWAHVLANPWSSLSVDLKVGNARRKTSAFNASALPVTESPLLRAYNYAPRDENFYSLRGSWSITPTLSWALEGTWTDDAYRLSPLGLQEGRDRRLSSTAAWAPRESLTLYANVTYQRITTLQNGAIGTGATGWQVQGRAALLDRRWGRPLGCQQSLGSESRLHARRNARRRACPVDWCCGRGISGAAQRARLALARHRLSLDAGADLAPALRLRALRRERLGAQRRVARHGAEPAGPRARSRSGTA